MSSSASSDVLRQPGRDEVLRFNGEFPGENYSANENPEFF